MSLNILILGTPTPNLLEAITHSKLLDKLYTALKTPIENIPNIEYSNYEELVKKAHALQIDITITFDSKLIQDGISDIFKRNRLNIISPNPKWFNLESNPIAAKQLLSYYSINTPPIIKAPLVFPVIIKTQTKTQIAVTMQ